MRNGSKASEPIKICRFIKCIIAMWSVYWTRRSSLWTKIISQRVQKHKNSRNFRGRQFLQSLNIWKNNTLKIAPNSFLEERKRSEKMAEEYCWAITQTVGRSCCSRSGTRVLKLGCQLNSFVYLSELLVDHMFVWMCGFCNVWVYWQLWGCYGNIRNCIYCVFALFRLCIFILICY
jgi:hypothetical protein